MVLCRCSFYYCNCEGGEMEIVKFSSHKLDKNRKNMHDIVVHFK